MRARTCAAAAAGALCSLAFYSISAYAQTVTPSPTPAPGIVSSLVQASSGTAGWLSGTAVEYAGSPLWPTIAGVAVIVLIVSLLFWLRRPRRPMDSDAPM